MRVCDGGLPKVRMIRHHLTMNSPVQLVAADYSARCPCATRTKGGHMIVPNAGHVLSASAAISRQLATVLQTGALVLLTQRCTRCRAPLFQPLLLGRGAATSA